MISLKTSNWQIENIDTILFDKDGTFIDLHYFWGKMTELRAQEVIKKFNLDSNSFEKICTILGYDINTQRMHADGITALYSRSKIIEIFKENLKDFQVNTTEKELENIFDLVSKKFYENMQEYTKPINTAIDFIKKIKKLGLKTGIVTSDSKESTLLTLRHFKWENLFDIVIGREDSPHTKESGEPTKLALNLLNANPNSTVMIGDAPMDFISATNAGIKNVILVATGQISKEELTKTSQNTINSLDEIEVTIN